MRARVTTTMTAALTAGLMLVCATGQPALADSATEATIVTAMQKEWVKIAKVKQVTTCKGYRENANAMITLSVKSIWKDADSREVLPSKSAWTRVISRYLVWACSGVGLTPR